MWKLIPTLLAAMALITAVLGPTAGAASAANDSPPGPGVAYPPGPTVAFPPGPSAVGPEV
jgi:hypothetical protein